MPTRAIVTLKSLSPASQGAPISEKRKNETYDQYEERVWRERLNCDEAGQVHFSQFALMNCVRDAAKFLGERTGKGTGTYVKYFDAGLLVIDEMKIFSHSGEPIMRDKVACQRRFVPSDGRPGGASRVPKLFPIIPEWTGVSEFTITSPEISEKVFRTHIEGAGLYIGLGSSRVRNRGIFGRFAVEKFKWVE